jgi:hypothetical protein
VNEFVQEAAALFTHPTISKYLPDMVMR